MNCFKRRTVCLCIIGWSGLLHAESVETAVDWPEFLGRHDLEWSSLPTDYQASAFLGNGLLGTTVYALDRKDLRLAWQMGRSDVVFRSNRIAIGHMVLNPVGTLKTFSMKLDLWNAELVGQLVTDKGRIRFRSLTHTERLVQVIEFMGEAGETDFRLEWKPGQAINPRILFGRAKITPAEQNPDPVLSSTPDGLNLCVQPLNTGGAHATAWREVPGADGSKIVYLSVGFSENDQSAGFQASESVNSAAREGLDSLVASHRAWWHAYYPKSFLSLPDTRLEGFYWIQIYKMASATRPGRPPMDLMGPWSRIKSPWPKIWWNLNAQMTYWPIPVANHPELAEPMYDMLDRNLGNLASNAAPFEADSAHIATATSYDCIGSGPEICNLPWMAHNYWLQYRYTMDDERLRQGLFPLLKRSINYYLHHLKADEQGRLHLTIGMSPEYLNQPRPNPNCNIDLALLRWGCETLLAICARLGIDDPLIPRWRETLDQLTPYPIDDTGLMISPTVPVAQSHRAFSHLLAFFPLHLLQWEHPSERDLIARSVRQWTALYDPKEWKGYSMTAAASMYALMNDPEESLRWLHLMLDTVHMPSTLYTSSGPCLEVPFSAAASLQDMVLQSWGDRIRVFPAVPASWSDLVFHNLRAEGAFLVSAVRSEGKTRWVRIKSLAGEPCRIAVALEGEPAFIPADVRIKSVGKEVYDIDLKKGDEVILCAVKGGQALSVRPIKEQKEFRNYFGSGADRKPKR